MGFRRKRARLDFSAEGQVSYLCCMIACLSSALSGIAVCLACILLCYMSRTKSEWLAIAVGVRRGKAKTARLVGRALFGVAAFGFALALFRFDAIAGVCFFAAFQGANRSLVTLNKILTLPVHRWGENGFDGISIF